MTSSVDETHSKRQFLSLNSIQDVLECIICLELPRKDPIYQCDNGHLLCEFCHKRVDECPLCKVNLKNIRALAVEKILRKCPRPCKFQGKGCSALMRQLSLKEHEKNCDFKPGLPSKLSANDKSSYIKILSDYKCEYNHVEAENSSNDYDMFNSVGSVRADNPIPSDFQGIYYFEIKVLNKGKDGAIGIGLTAEGSALHRMPGWEHNTIGYHGDDGKFFYEACFSKKFGPLFKNNDIVGCGINFHDMSVFFTINGRYLGVAKHNLPEIEYYPTIYFTDTDIFHSSNYEMVQVNFGQDPFAFQIDYLSGKSWIMNFCNNISNSFHFYTKINKLSQTMFYLVFRIM